MEKKLLDEIKSQLKENNIGGFIIGMDNIVPIATFPIEYNDRYIKPNVVIACALVNDTFMILTIGDKAEEFIDLVEDEDFFNETRILTESEIETMSGYMVEFDSDVDNWDDYFGKFDTLNIIDGILSYLHLSYL